MASPINLIPCTASLKSWFDQVFKKKEQTEHTNRMVTTECELSTPDIFLLYEIPTSIHQKKKQMKVTLCLKWKSDASLGKNEELGESTTSTIKRLQTQAYTLSCHCEVVVTVKTVFQVVLGSTYWPQIIVKVLRSTSGFKRYHTSVSASLGWCMLVSPFTKFLFIKWKNHL